MIPILPHDLADMNALAGAHPLRIDLVYADAQHPENIFGINLYRPSAKFWLHRLFAPIVLDAARHMAERHGARLVLKDGLRPVEAQAAMQDTIIVRAHPEWCEEPRMLSRPGQGGHPRGMAIDVAVEDAQTGAPWDMGTVFDTMTPHSARAFKDFPLDVLNNRQKLELAFTESAARRNLPLLPLPSEWWDFRFPASFSETYAPVTDAGLPADIRMTG